MQYMILIYGDERAWASAPKAAAEQMHAAHMQYAKEMTEKKVIQSFFRPLSSPPRPAEKRQSRVGDDSDVCVRPGAR